jgi:hypothetical protein
LGFDVFDGRLFTRKTLIGSDHEISQAGTNEL